MDAIKQAVVQTLAKQGIISQLKAQLRAQVFVAVEEYDSASSGSGLAAKTIVPARKALLTDSDGQVAVQLVLDLLDTCNFAFTKKVFQPELGPTAPEDGRQAVAQKLGIKPSSPDEPLLVTLLKAFQSGSSRPAVAASSTPAPVRPAVNSSNASGSAAPAASRPAPTSGGSLPAPSRPSDSSSSTATALAPARAPAAAPGPAPAPAPATAPRLNKPVMAPLPQLGLAASKPSPAAAPMPAPMPASAPAPVPAKPKPEPSAEDTQYSDEEFEEVDDDVEDEGAGLVDDDDDDDYAAALGYKSTSAAPGKDIGDSGRDRQASGQASATSSSRGRTALDADLMAGDRSFGISNELAGLDPGNSGGLSFSADFPTGGPGDLRASLSSSQAMLSPISEGTPKLAKLEPLRPIASKLSPLGPLAPLQPIGTLSSSLSSSKDDPLGTKGPKALGPLGASVRKSLVDIEKEKEELRRLGLLQSGDSLGNSIEVESRPRHSGPSANIYDAEMSVSASMDDGAWGGGGGRDERLPFGSKGLSMDLRDTGLSASDRSGDIEHMGVDLAETAEWH